MFFFSYMCKPWYCIYKIHKNKFFFFFCVWVVTTLPHLLVLGYSLFCLVYFHNCLRFYFYLFFFISFCSLSTKFWMRLTMNILDQFTSTLPASLWISPYLFVLFVMMIYCTCPFIPHWTSHFPNLQRGSVTGDPHYFHFHYYFLLFIKDLYTIR